LNINYVFNYEIELQNNTKYQKENEKLRCDAVIPKVETPGKLCGPKLFVF